MKRIVIDTNVYVSALIFGGMPFEAVTWCQNHAKIYISIDIINEIKGVLEYKFLFGEDEINEVIEIILSDSKIIFPKKKISVFKNNGDNRVLECAVEAACDIIISGDKKHLITLREYSGIDIISPQEFCQRFT